MSYRIAVDVGSTFTDILVQHGGSGAIQAGKVLADGEAPASAVLEALGRLVPEPRAVEVVVVGTTLAQDRAAAAWHHALEALSGALPTARLQVIQPNGGVAGVVPGGQRRVVAQSSAGGALGARRIAHALGWAGAICLDAGGTSSDVSLLISGEPLLCGHQSAPAIDITAVGAGGGSVARRDGAALRVGPGSAGAEPGPACFGRGGAEATVTDAALALGRFAELRFPASGTALRSGGARTALAALGRSLGSNAEAVAGQMLDVVTATLADAIRALASRHGVELRSFALIAYGAMGPTHAAELAGELGIAKLVIPAHPGAFSAWGMLHSDARHDLHGPFARPLAALGEAEAGRLFDRLEAEGRDRLRAELVPEPRISTVRLAELRYIGHDQALTLALDDRDSGPEALKRRFDALHERSFGRSDPAAPAELVGLRVTATGAVERPAPELRPGGRERWPVVRQASFGGRWLETEIVARDAMAGGELLSGPALVHEATATTVVPPGWDAWLADERHLILTRNGAGR